MKNRGIAGLVTALAVLVLALGGVTSVARAGSVSSTVLGMLPKNVGEIGYADLKTAREAHWFAQFEAQIMPIRFQHFERYVGSAGMDLDKQLDEIVWATAAPAGKAPASAKDSGGAPPAAPERFTGEEVVGIGLGNFAPDEVDEFFTKQKLPTVRVRGYTLYAFGSGMSPGDLLFFFLDPNTIAFGHRELLEKLIGVHFGDEDSFLQNDTLGPLVDEVNGQGTIWAAMDKTYSQAAMERLLPDLAQFSGASQLLDRVKGMTLTVQTDSGADAEVIPHCASADDALTLAQLLQAGLLYKRYQASQNSPDLASALDATKVSAEGDHLNIRARIPEDLLLSLLRSNTFSFPM